MEDFVTFDIAKKLKDKGFKEECFARYYCSDKIYFERNSYHPDTESIFYCYNNDEDLGRFYIDAPTISQVLKWLRKEKKMHIIIPASFEDGYWWEVRDFNREISEYSCVEDTSYEEAAISGIEYVLDNLI